MGSGVHPAGLGTLVALLGAQCSLSASFMDEPSPSLAKLAMQNRNSLARTTQGTAFISLSLIFLSIPFD